MKTEKLPRPDFQKVNTQDMMRIYINDTDNKLETYKALSCVKPNTALDSVLTTFRKNTNIPLVMPMMAFIHIVGTWLISKSTTLEVKGRKMNPDLWTIILSSSGSGKTFAFNQVEKASKKILNIKANFDSVASAAAYMDELQEKNGSLWFADEFAQFLGQVEQMGSPLSQCKEYLLKTYDGNTIQRKTRAATIEIEKPILSILGSNTLDSYLKKISEESFTDGFSQRFSYILAEADPERPMKDHSFFNETAIQTDIEQAFTQLVKTPTHQNYKMSDEAFEAFENSFQELLAHGVGESFYRRLMFISFKYALIFHVIYGDASDTITKDDMCWAMRLIDLHLNDLKKLLELYNYGDVFKTLKRIEAKKAEFALKGKPFGAREVVQNVKAIKSVQEAKSYIAFMDECAQLNWLEDERKKAITKQLV